MKLEDIKRHWEQAGQSFPAHGPITPTSRDPYLGRLERDNILSHLAERHTCLEIGCGDGQHTVHYARKAKKIFALDISAGLVSVAQKRLEQESLENVELFVGSMLNLGEIFQGQQFDCIISQRCLINLPDWEHQRMAMLQAYDLLKEGGLFLLTEGFQDNLNKLNAIRTAMSLPEIKVAPYNRNFLSHEFDKFIGQYFELIDQRHYGLYLFLSRVYHPLVVSPEEPRHDSKMNDVAMRLSQVLSLPDMEKYSYNLFYALKKNV